MRNITEICDTNYWVIWWFAISIWWTVHWLVAKDRKTSASLTGSIANLKSTFSSLLIYFFPSSRIQVMEIKWVIGNRLHLDSGGISNNFYVLQYILPDCRQILNVSEKITRIIYKARFTIPFWLKLYLFCISIFNLFCQRRSKCEVWCKKLKILGIVGNFVWNLILFAEQNGSLVSP